MKRKILLLFSLFAAVIISNHVNAQIVFVVETPTNLEGNYNFTYADTWGADMNTTAITAPLAIISDGTAADSLGCGAAVNGADITGKFAVVYRGACQFGTKALNAQNAGAVGVIIINNQPGGPVGMAGGTDGASVTIPVIMISMEDGADFRSAIDAGTMTAFIGNKSGFYATDLGFYKNHVVMASGAAVPQQVAPDSNAFEIPVGAWVYNYGSTDQSNITVSAEITHATSTIYSNSTIVNILSGDSTFVALSNFAEATYPLGSYTLTYTIAASAADEYPADNEIITNFSFTDAKYSKVMLDPNTLLPIKSNSTRAGGVLTEFKWCTSIQAKDAVTAEIQGLSFSATSATTISLENKGLTVEIYRWPYGAQLASVVLVEQAFYDYTADLQDSLVTAKFDNPIPLVTDTVYLGCVTVYDDSLYIGYSSALDYETNQSYYDDAYSPVFVNDGAAGTWYGLGFGTDYTPALIIEFAPTDVSIEENKITAKDNMPYPNPANNYISIPLKGEYTGMVELNVIDITGKVVKSEMVNLSNTNVLKVNTSDIENGTYFFQLRSGDKKASTFSVVISK